MKRVEVSRQVARGGREEEEERKKRQAGREQGGGCGAMTEAPLLLAAVRYGMVVWCMVRYSTV